MAPFEAFTRDRRDHALLLDYCSCSCSSVLLRSCLFSTSRTSLSVSNRKCFKSLAWINYESRGHSFHQGMLPHLCAFLSKPWHSADHAKLRSNLHRTWAPAQVEFLILALLAYLGGGSDSRGTDWSPFRWEQSCPCGTCAAFCTSKKASSSQETSCCRKSCAEQHPRSVRSSNCFS